MVPDPALPLQMGFPGGVELLVIFLIWIPLTLVPLVLAVLAVYYLRRIAHALEEMVEDEEDDSRP